MILFVFIIYFSFVNESLYTFNYFIHRHLILQDQNVMQIVMQIVIKGTLKQGSLTCFEYSEVSASDIQIYYQYKVNQY